VQAGEFGTELLGELSSDELVVLDESDCEHARRYAGGDLLMALPLLDMALSNDALAKVR